MTTTSSDSKASNCKYTGGVNCNISDGPGAYCSGSNDAFSGDESLVELEGEELVENLKTLKAVELAREALNFIEFFWGSVKKYLQDNYDYTFNTLKENLPKALESVPLSTIRKWEHCVFQWMVAYRSGMGTEDTQNMIEHCDSILKYTCFLLNCIRTLVQLMQPLKGTSNSCFTVSQCLFQPPGAPGEGICNYLPN